MCIENIKIEKRTINIIKEIINKENLDEYKYSRRIRDYIKQLPQNLSKESKVLDIGLAHGLFSVLIKCEFNCEIWGIDKKRRERKVDRIKQGKWLKRYKSYDINFTYCDITKEYLPFSKKEFDLVIFTEVLEHLITNHPPIDELYKIRKVMKKGGTLILSTPNYASISRRINHLFGKQRAYGFRDRNSNVPSYGKHFKEYTLSELKYILEKANYKNIQTSYVNHSPKPSELYGNIFNILSNLYAPFRNTIILKTSRKYIRYYMDI